MLRLFTFLILFVSLFAHPSFAEAPNVEKAELSRETTVKKYPTLDATSLGRLPKGTIVELSGEEDNGFAEAEIELSNGTILNGWIEIPSIKGREGEKRKEKPKPVKKEGKLTVPKDEGVLLRREQSFYYGLAVGGNLSSVSYVEAEEAYNGMSFNGEAHVGLYFNSYSRAQLNLGYYRAEGKDSEGTNAGFGFLDVSLEGQLVVEERMLISGGLGYLMGIGITAAPSTFTLLESAGDATTLTGLVGVGYRHPLNDVSSLGIKGTYLFGFKRDPIGVQGFLLSVFLDFEG